MIRSFVLSISLGALTWSSAGSQQVVTSAQQHTARVSLVAKQSYSLDAPVSLVVEKGKLESVLLDIASQMGTKPMFSDEVRNVRKPVTLNLSKVPARRALDEALRGTGIVYRMYATGEIAFSRVIARSTAIGNGVVAGKVVEAKTGKGVAGAVVAIVSEAGSGFNIHTGEDGSYRLAGLNSGAYTITVRLVGYAKQTRSITVGDGATITADFKLEPSASVLDQVVVTGTVVATELKAVPNAITVITAKQIQERGITRIDELFRGDIPGLFSLNRGAEAQLDEVTMFSRGATAFPSGTSAGTGSGTNPIKTYIDGVEMVNPAYLSQIDPSTIERIEILTGPQASTIYGSNAINGVMQVFTKRGIGTKPQLTLDLKSGMTQNNFSSHVAPSHTADLGVRGTEGRLGYHVGGSWNYAGEWTPGKQSQRLSINGATTMSAGKLTADVSARKGFTKNRTNGSIQAGQTALRTSGIFAPNASTGIATNGLFTLDGATTGLSLSYGLFPWWSHQLTVGSDASASEFVKHKPTFANKADTSLRIYGNSDARTSQSYNSTLQISMASLAHLDLTFGGDHWRTRRSYRDITPQSLTGSFSSADQVMVSRYKPEKNTGAFVQGQLGFREALFFTYGIRADWNPNFGEDAEVKPGRYGVSYVRDIGPVTAKFRGSYGRSIRPPGEGYTSATPETYADYINQFGQHDVIIANRNLGPEHQSGGEGGVDLYLGSRASLTVTRYNQTVDNLIESVDGADSVRSLLTNLDYYGALYGIATCEELLSLGFGNCGYAYRWQYQYLNVGSIRNQGWELQGQMQLGRLTTSGTYSWTKSRVIGITPKYKKLLANNPAFTVGRPFQYLPEHTWALGFNYVQARSTVRLNVMGIAQRYVDYNYLNIAMTTHRITQTQGHEAGNIFALTRPIGPGYAMADLNATHRFSSRVDAVLTVKNLTDYYQHDASALYPTAGRSSQMGLRLRW